MVQSYNTLTYSLRWLRRQQLRLWCEERRPRIGNDFDSGRDRVRRDVRVAISLETAGRQQVRCLH